MSAFKSVVLTAKNHHPMWFAEAGKGDSSTLAAAPEHNVDGRLFKQGCEIKTVGTSDESGSGQAGAGLTVVVILL